MNDHIASITALVVTYNRRDLLDRCLSLLAAQTRKLDHILVVDNASTDDTRTMLERKGWCDRSDFSLLSLPQNTGGAGGFAAGLQHAFASGADWVWMMDDDAAPHADALERLLDVDPQPDSLYGSVAHCNTRLVWPMTPYANHGSEPIAAINQLDTIVDVQFIPFVGLMVSRKVFNQIGTPDAGFFIAADDVDYCLRARARGIHIWLVGSSQIEHPMPARYVVPIPWSSFDSLRLPPWKRYYDVRNRILVAKAHYGMALYYGTIPRSFLRLMAALWHEPDRPQQILAFFAGMTDGLLGRKGRRHEIWRIKT